MQNALATIAVADYLGVGLAVLRQALTDFKGEKVIYLCGELALASGGSALVVDDYGHHPTAIRATIESAKSMAQSTYWHFSRIVTRAQRICLMTLLC